MWIELLFIFSVKKLISLVSIFILKQSKNKLYFILCPLECKQGKIKDKIRKKIHIINKLKML